MSQASDVEQRLEALEIKASFTEDMVDRLEQIIIEQQKALDSLAATVARLREQAASQGEAGAPRNLRDELPPHY